MSSEMAFIPGSAPPAAGPLSRFMPPIAEGTARAWLSQRLPPSSWVLDPFGASPRLAVEAARAGYRVLVAANNPIARFLLELHANPLDEAQLRAALADLGASQKGDERLEPHVRALYMSECAHCGRRVQVNAFVWERDAKAPSSLIYDCPNCQASGEQPASAADAERAARFASSALHRARALERVAPLADPDREHVEEALSMYLPRTVYALFTLVNKLEGFPGERRRALQALLLAAFDQTNLLWAYPTTRSRPRQLTQPPRFLEKNVWLALEEAVQAWTTSIPERDILPVVNWPETPPPQGGLCIFEGRLKDLADHLASDSQAGVRPQAALTALPRPNQAYWTLSALWAGWLWGYEASAPFKSVLRRRRYDWSWHTIALQAAHHHLARILPASAPCLELVAEAEAGFISAAILAAASAGFELQGLALRVESGQAQIHLRRAAGDALKAGDSPSAEQRQAIAQRAGRAHLRQRGEPAAYLHLHSAALASLAQAGALTIPAENSPADLLREIDEALEAAFSYRGGFARYGGGRPAATRSRETGLWWLEQEIERSRADELPLPLADRVEMEVVRSLGQHPGCSFNELDLRLCKLFRGQLTPEIELIQACLDSYGERLEVADASGHPAWRLRPQDLPQARRADLAAMKAMLAALGARLGYQVEAQTAGASTGPAPPRAPILWRDADGALAYSFYLLASAVLGNIVFPAYLPRRFDLEAAPEQPPSNWIVVPGGRAGLLAHKMRRDPRLQSAVEANWRFLKFRHLRWLAESETLERENLDEQLGLDPLANRDPQMQLL
ncbi:MAG: hypothetical protein JXA78_17255 [Anaerolineales bacterium]|nr:hypothetical protein [Anaerolineales bacterium]